MGKLGPLTSQALGRSPYDDVVQGEGEDNPSVPRQQYDERGRSICPETKKINKDVVRSHNEVMQVIGVAEPEDGAQAAQVESANRHTTYEDYVGLVCCEAARTLELTAFWGLNATRQRILLYKQYARIPFYDLFRFEREQRSASTSLLAGLPCFIANQALRQLLAESRVLKYGPWAQRAIKYLGMHLEVYVFLQRMGIISARAWLPSPLFFIPFSTASPIPPLPRLSSPTWKGLVQWGGEVAVGVAPFALFFGFTWAWSKLSNRIWSEVYRRLPRPTNAPGKKNVRQVSTAQTRSPTASRTPVTPTAAPAAESSIRSEISTDLTAQTGQQGEAITPAPNAGQDGLSNGTARRQSTALSAHGDDYASEEEEETEMVSATLISFDVEQTESADTPPGIWAAELRPNVSESSRAAASAQQRGDAPPLYRENRLTTLPAVLAGDVLGLMPARIAVAPIEVPALRAIARAFMLRQGLSTAGVYGVNPFSDITFGAVANLLGLELVHMLIQGDIWALVTMVVQSFRLTEEEWLENESGMPPDVAET